MDHTQVLRDAVAGEDQALCVLVSRYHARVYRFGRRVCRDAFDAEDAVQEAFIKLARRPDVQRDQGALSWLMSVVRNACLRLLSRFSVERRSLGDAAGDAEGLADEGLAPDALLERWQLVDRVHRVIASLSRDHREVLILRDLEGLSGAEAAASLGVSEGVVKTRLHRARTALRERLREDGVK